MPIEVTLPFVKPIPEVCPACGRDTVSPITDIEAYVIYATGLKTLHNQGKENQSLTILAEPQIIAIICKHCGELLQYPDLSFKN